jgi:tetratricopeptide (TPR) repeat protein
MNRQPVTLLLCILLAAGLAAAGCAAKSAAARPEEPVNWTMTPDTAADYFYLVYYDALRDGDAETAGEALRQIIELQPAPLIYLELADLKLRQGDVAAARETLKKGLTTFPDDQKLTARLADTYQPSAATTTPPPPSRSTSSAIPRRWRCASSSPRPCRGPQVRRGTRRALGHPRGQRTPDVIFLEARASARLGMRDKAIGCSRRSWPPTPKRHGLGRARLPGGALQGLPGRREGLHPHHRPRRASDEVWRRLIRLASS